LSFHFLLCVFIMCICVSRVTCNTEFLYLTFPIRSFIGEGEQVKARRESWKVTHYYWQLHRQRRCKYIDTVFRSNFISEFHIHRQRCWRVDLCSKGSILHCAVTSSSLVQELYSLSRFHSNNWFKINKIISYNTRFFRSPMYFGLLLTFVPLEENFSADLTY